jgi:uncharacterized protein
VSVAAVVTDNAERSRYELHVDGELAGFADYRVAGASVVVPHVEVDPDREGRGLGTLLVRETLARIEASGRTVIPTCPFAAAYIRRHPELAGLVEPSLRPRFLR